MIMVYLICSTIGIRDSVRKNMFYKPVDYCVQDRTAEWALYHPMDQLTESVEEFSVSDVV